MTVKIMIDPGHGGMDPGAEGFVTEKHITLQVGFELQKYLSENYKCRARLTRARDIYVSQRMRAKLSNQWGADLFLSIHCSAGGGQGLKSYVANENVFPETLKTRDHLHRELSNAFKKIKRKDNGRHAAGFYVLKETRASAVMIICCFVDNYEDACILKNDEYREKLVKGLAVGIKKTLELSPAEEEPVTSRYTVKSGDNISYLSGCFGVPVRYLLKFNPVIEKNGKIYPGQVLTIPSRQLLRKERAACSSAD